MSQEELGQELNSIQVRGWFSGETIGIDWTINDIKYTMPIMQARDIIDMMNDCLIKAEADYCIVKALLAMSDGQMEPNMIARVLELVHQARDKYDQTREEINKNNDDEGEEKEGDNIRHLPK